MARVSKRLRYEVLRRDGFKCRYCGAVAAATELRVDHVVPESLGGGSVPSNLAASCEPCNSGKSSVPPEAPVVDQVADDALRWSAAMQRAAADMEAKLKERDDQNVVFLDEWNAYRYGHDSDHFPLDPTWSATLVRLRVAGLTDRLIIEAVSATMGAQKVLPENRFRYFCGVSWNMISQLQEAAEGIASGDEEEALFPDMTREGVAAALDFFRAVTETFIGMLPPWVNEMAEADIANEFKETAQTHVPYVRRLTYHLMFVAFILRDCEVRDLEKKGDE
jgi:hypothetical protein